MHKTSLLVFSCLLGLFSFAGELQIITSGGFQGIADEEGEVLIPAIYERLGWSDGGDDIMGEAIGYYENGRWGLINIRSKKLTSAKYASLKPFSEELYEAGITGKFSNLIFRGLIDIRSKVYLDFKYYTIDNIGDHRVVASEYVSGDLKYGLFSDENQVIIPAEYHHVKRLGNLIVVENFHNKKRLYDIDGQVKVFPWIDHIEPVEEGFRISNEGYYGLLNAEGCFVHDLKFKKIEEGKTISFPEWELRIAGEESGWSLSCDSITYDKQSKLMIAHVNNVEHLLAASDRLFKDQKHSLKFIGSGFIVTKNRISQQWGIYKTDGREVMSGFDSVVVDTAYFYAQSQGQWFVYNRFGRQISTKTFQDIGLSHQGFIPIKSAGYWGWLDFQGEQVVKAKYDQVLNGQNDHYLAKNFGLWGIRSFYGDWLVMPKYDSITVVENFYLAKKGAATHVYDEKPSLLYQLPFQVKEEGLLKVCDEELEGVITRKGFYLEPKYVQVSVFDRYYALNDGAYCSLIQDSGQEVFGTDEGIQEVLSLSEEYFHIIKDNKHGFVDKNGKLRIANRYDSVQYFNEGLAPVKLLGKWGFIGPYENLIIQPFYQSSSVFENGLAIIQIDDLYGLIDKKGQEIIQPKWKFIERLATGNYRVIDAEDNVGIANVQGRFMLRPNYQSITDTFKDLLIVNRMGKFGVLDYTGLTKIPFEYDEIQIVGDYVLLRK